MPFCVLGGITIPIAAGEATKRREIIGERTRAFSGELRSSVRARKDSFPMRTIPMAPALADAIVALVEGQGHRWAFDEHLYSDKGLGLFAGSGAGASLGTTAPVPKYGAKRLGLAAAASVTYATALGGAWTVMVWRWSGSAWVHYAIRSDGAKWIGVARNDAAATPWLQVDGAGNVTIVAGGAEFYDDLVCLPYLVPAEWVAAWAVRSSAFSPLPRLHLTGDIGTALVEGEAESVPAIRANIAGGKLARTVNLTLSEV